MANAMSAGAVKHTKSSDPIYNSGGLNDMIQGPSSPGYACPNCQNPYMRCQFHFKHVPTVIPMLSPLMISVAEKWANCVTSCWCGRARRPLTPSILKKLMSIDQLHLRLAKFELMCKSWNFCGWVASLDIMFHSLMSSHFLHFI